MERLEPCFTYDSTLRIAVTESLFDLKKLYGFKWQGESLSFERLSVEESQKFHLMVNGSQEENLKFKYA